MAGLGSSMTNFADNLMSCHGAGGALSPIDEQDCVWSELAPGSQHQSASNGNVAYDGHDMRAQIGGQRHVTDNWVIGGSLGYDTWRRNVTGLARLGGDDFAAGAVAKYLQGPWVNALALSVSYGTFDSTRWVTLPALTAVTGNSDVLFAGIRGRSTYLFDAAPFYFKPYADVTIGYYHMGGFAERGASGGVGLNVAGLDETAATLAPMLEAGTVWQLNSGYALRPYVAGGVALSTQGAWVAMAGFQGVPAGIADMRVSQNAHDVLGQLVMGVELLTSDTTLLRLQYDARFAPHYTEANGVLKMGIRF